MRFLTGLLLGAVLVLAVMPALTFESSAAPGDGIIINEIYYDPDGPEVENEWVELWNSGTQAVNILNWTISDQDGGVDYLFPDIDCPVGALFLVHTGQGQNSSSFVSGKAHFYMWKSSSIWSPTGDDVLLANSTDATVDFVSYGQWNGSSTDPPPADFTYTHSNASAAEGFSMAFTDGGFRQSVPTPLEQNGDDVYEPLLITGVYYAPYGENEFVKLHNPLDYDVDISFWYLTDGEGFAAFPADTTLAPGQSIIVCQNSTNYFIETLVIPDFELTNNSAGSKDMTIIDTQIQLANDGDEAFLNNRFGTQIDAFVYGDSDYYGPGWAGAPAGKLGQGKVAKRNFENVFADANTSADWNNVREYGIAQSDFPVQTFAVSGGIGVFTSPDTSFGEIVKAINLAQTSIDINLYEFTNTRLAACLIDALARGVSVNLFLEGAPVGGINATELYIARQLVENGGCVRILTNDADNDIHQRYSYDHAKYAIIDNYTLLIMSENWVWTGVPLTGDVGNRGWGMRIDDSAVARYFSDVFFTDWEPRMKDSVAFDSNHLKWNDGINCTHDTWSYEANFDSARFTTAATITPVIVPEQALSQETILGMLSDAQDRVVVEQFYSYKHWGDKVTGSTTETPNIYLEAVIGAARRGCEVRVLLDSSYYNTDSEDPIDNDDTVEYINTIAAAEGLDMEAKLVNLTEHRYTKIHNKGLIADDSVLISSINWNLNSVTKNREAGLIVENGDVADYFASVFEYDWKDDLTPPEAIFNMSETYEINEFVEFNASTSSDNVGIVNYTWILDDALASNQQVWETMFTVPENHTATLIVEDAWGNTGSLTREFSVLPQYDNNNTANGDANNTDSGTNTTDSGGDNTAAIIIGLVLLAPVAIFIGILYILRVKGA